jgi:hypothetical protein
MTKKQYSLMLVLALVAGLVGGVVSSQFLLGQPALAEKRAESKRIIEAEEFRLIDREGKHRITLKMEGLRETIPKLKFFDSDGKKTISLSGGSWPSMALWDESGSPRITIQLLAGIPTFQFYHQDATVSLMFSGSKQVLRDVSNNRIELSADGEPFLALADKTGLPRAILGSTEIKVKRTGEIRKRPVSSLVLFNEQGNVILEAP